MLITHGYAFPECIIRVGWRIVVSMLILYHRYSSFATAFGLAV